MKQSAHGVFYDNGDDLEPGAWHNIGDPGEPAFVNSWGAAAATPLATFGPARYYRGAGRGYVTAAIADGTAPSTAFTLPAGYRPDYTVLVLAFSVDNAGTTVGTALCSVTPDGSVFVASNSEANVLINADFRLA